MEKIGIILVGHGSKEPYNKEAMEYFAEKLKSKYPYVSYAFIQINKPLLKESLIEAVKSGIEKIIVQPIFLARGVHVDFDIPSILGLTPENKRGIIEVLNRKIEITISEPIGKDDRILDIIIDRIEEALRH